MKHRIHLALGLGILGLFPITAVSQEAGQPAPTIIEQWTAEPTTIFNAQDVDLAEFIWTLRPLVVFADSPNDPQFKQQMELLADRPEDLAERDVIVIVDTDPAAQTSVRLALRPRGYMMALIDKDGRVALRKPLPWDVRELSRSIDNTSIREQEIKDRRGG
jgi:hypothetical protein